MREIKFRGFVKGINEWIYGGIVHQTDWYGNKCDKWFIVDGTSTYDYEMGENYIVAQESVGEYIGLEDKNGTEIYEGDIVFVQKEDGYFEIEWDEDTASFVMANEKVLITFDNYDSYDVEVVGNVWENPELLKVGV